MRFSASSYKEYQQCGLRFRYHKIDRIPTKGESTHHRWFGKLVHEVVYAGLGTKVDSKSYKLYDETNVDYAVSLIDGIWDGEPKDDIAQMILDDIGPRPEVFSPGKIKALQGENLLEGWREQAKKMVGNAIPALAGLHKDIVELELVEHWTFQGKEFMGYLDIVTNNEDGKLTFYDLKTSWNKPGKKLQNDFQFFIYSYALKQTRNLDYYPDGYWVHVKDGSLIPFKVTQETIDKHMAEAAATFDYIEKGVFPSIYGSPLCKFCDYFELCYGEGASRDAF